MAFFIACFTKPTKSKVSENNSVRKLGEEDKGQVIFVEKQGRSKLFRKAITIKRDRKKRLYTTSVEQPEERLQSLKLDERRPQG